MIMDRERNRFVSRRSILTGASVVLAGTALTAAPLAFAKASAPDPVFAVLGAYQRAYEDHLAAIDATDAAQVSSGFGSRKYLDVQAAQFAACAADTEVWWRLIETQPTTLPGLLAYARVLAEHHDTVDIEDSGGAAVQTIAAALEALMPASLSA